MAAPQQHDEDVDSAEFQLPLLGLYADLELGRGSVSLPDEFTQAPASVQLALIDDWQRGLAQLRLRLQHPPGTAPQD